MITRTRPQFPRQSLIVWLALFSALCASDSFADTWPQWRGREGNNHASADTRVPLKWDLETGENVIWKCKLPGRGHSTPIVIDQGIFLTASEASDQSQSMIRIDPNLGRIEGQWVLHRQTLPQRIHPKNTHASPSPAFNGEHVFVAFHTDDSIMLSAMTPKGSVVWQKRVSGFKPGAFQFGYGASPIIEDDLVIVAAEYDGSESGLYALDTRTGKQVWKVPRPSNLNFASPIIATITGQRQLLIAGADAFSSYNPLTGKRLWQTDSATEAICGTVVWDNRRVLVSGGNPLSGTWCVLGDGTGKVLWENYVKCYEQSLLAIPNYVFAISDGGVAHCWRTQDGKEMWKQRLFSGPVSASPLLVGDRIYAANEGGEVVVIKASPDRFEELSRNKTGDGIFATPVAVNDRLYIRTFFDEGDQKQDYLIAIGTR